MMGTTSDVVRTVLLCVTTVCALAVLAISIAIVVKVYTAPDADPSPNPVTLPNPVSTTRPATERTDVTTTLSSTIATPQSVFHHTDGPVPSDSPLAAAYQQVTDLFRATINASADPCNDFYGFACGNFDPNGQMGFDRLDNRNGLIMEQQLQDPNYRASALPKPVKQLLLLFDTCRTAESPPPKQNVTYKKLLQFQTITQLSFPLLDQTDANYTMPNATTLAKAIGFLEGVYRLGTFLSQYIDINWRDPQSTEGYLLFVDQPSLLLPPAAYLNNFSQVEDYYNNDLVQHINILKPSLNQTRLKQDVNDMLQLELRFAQDLITTNSDMARQYNLFSRRQATKRYPFIDWYAYLEQVSTHASASVQAKMLGDHFDFIITQPKMLDKLGVFLATEQFSPQTVMNYLNFRLVLELRSFSYASGQRRKKSLPEKTRVGNPRYFRTPSSRTTNRDSVIDYVCTYVTMMVMPYAHARVFVDALYPTSEGRTKFRNSASKLIDSVVLAFRSMIDELSWMSASSKKGAYYKIDNLVKNIGYPDFVIDDSKLTEYYASLNISDTDSYESMGDKLEIFEWRKMFAFLDLNQTQRDNFNDAPVTVNAWYQDELNSITLPIGILQPPFYAPQWPASVNYGAIGVVAGHELTHGFDNTGVLWDGTGVMYRWMDNSSYASFNEMVDCVIKEYGSFCPLPESNSPANCVNGTMTQGENIADNGGLHAAYRAYRAFVEFNGPDPLLNDPIMSQFTHDQLFFMGFAQVWCESPDDGTEIIPDPHSPSLYRVLGTIQNNPSFREAFHCPLNSKYAPQKHCNVWTSESAITYGIPEIDQNSELNVQPQERVQPDQPDKYNAYISAVDMFQASMNISANPCTNFYEYVCGNYESQKSSFAITSNLSLVKMATQMESTKYRTPQTPLSLQKTIQFYDACKLMYTNYTENIRNGSVLLKALSDFETATGLQFSMVYNQSSSYTPVLNNMILAKAIGTLSRTGIHTLLTPNVDTNWMTAEDYLFFLDQNTLHFPKSYYTQLSWKTIYPLYKNNTVDLFNHFASFAQVTLNQTKLNSDVDTLLEFERTLATSYSRNATVRRRFKRFFNDFTFVQAQNEIRFIDLATYFASLSSDFQQLADHFTDRKLAIIIMEPYISNKLSEDFAFSRLDTSVVTNYFFLRIIQANSAFFPRPSGYQALDIESDGIVIGQERQKKRAVVFGKSLEGESLKTGCAQQTLQYMQYTNGRIFIDYLYPDQTSRDQIYQSIGKIIANVKLSFRGMLNRLKWMDDKSKKGAYAKLDDLRQNIAFPPFITDDAQLDAYYATLAFSSNDGYLSMLEQLQAFHFQLSYGRLLNHTAVDRDDFMEPPGTVDAWYQPTRNSITIPAGILQRPFYDDNWPTSMNYGALALIAGHELTHAFDDAGVQWNATGQLKKWMTKSSSDGFMNMTQCVIDQYSGFCPLDGTGKQPPCIDGEQTEGENIADNGGIHAAWMGYQNHIALNGPDPRLPDVRFNEFTHDQLFFMGFTRVWCSQEPNQDDLYRNILTDPHSPARYRVLGTIQNFPAFRTAFHCPADLPYSPSKHCSVWVHDVGA